MGVKSVRQCIGGTVYTNKLRFKIFIPCSNETSSKTWNTLMGFIVLVGLPQTLHSDNHKNFKEGIFKQLIQNFGTISTHMEPHLPWKNRAKPETG